MVAKVGVPAIRNSIIFLLNMDLLIENWTGRRNRAFQKSSNPKPPSGGIFHNRMARVDIGARAPSGGHSREQPKHSGRRGEEGRDLHNHDKHVCGLGAKITHIWCWCVSSLERQVNRACNRLNYRMIKHNWSALYDLLIYFIHCVIDVSGAL